MKLNNSSIKLIDFGKYYQRKYDSFFLNTEIDIKF